MFNSRRITRPVNLAHLEKNDLVSLRNKANKTAEERIVLRHEASITALKNKVNANEQRINTSDEQTQDAKIETLREQCSLQSDMLQKYEVKLTGMVGYIKRLEEGLEKVKELLANNTNTADTMDDAPEPAVEPEPEPAVEQEPTAEQTVTVESVSSENANDGEISLEITEN
jgi:hypothetical protein